MGGTKKLSKFIVDWENGTRVACKNGAIEREMCICPISVGQFSRKLSHMYINLYII